jgi:hypothetical protein
LLPILRGSAASEPESVIVFFKYTYGNIKSRIVLLG